MQVLKCKTCGANLEILDRLQVYECPYCGTKQVITADENGSSLKDFDIKAGVLIKYNGESDIVSIPKKVKSIGKEAFKGMSIVEVTIPSMVVSIQESAFEKCSCLQKINIPKNVSKISDLAFYGCTSLKNVTIENGKANISPNAFVGCPKDAMIIKMVDGNKVILKPKSSVIYGIECLISAIIVFLIIVGILKVLVFLNNLF